MPPLELPASAVATSELEPRCQLSAITENLETYSYQPPAKKRAPFVRIFRSG